MNIQLQDENGQAFETIEVPSEIIADASILTHNGHYYLFKGLSGRFFTGAIFVRVQPPVEV